MLYLKRKNMNMRLRNVQCWKDSFRKRMKMQESMAHHILDTARDLHAALCMAVTGVDGARSCMLVHHRFTGNGSCRAPPFCYIQG